LAGEIAVTAGDPEKALAAPYLEAVVKETLRINPVIPVVSRRLVVPSRLGGIDFPAGVQVVPCAHLAHRRPEAFRSPEIFRPERFLERQFGPSEYFPFGGGMRRCLGMGLAMMEMKLVIAAAFSRWSFEGIGNDAPHPVRRSVAIAPSPGPRALCRPALPFAVKPQL
jgi:cytochrome P450